MKTPIRASSKAKRSFVPITPFAFENFEVPVRRVTGHRPLPVGVAFKRLSLHLRSRFKTTPRLIDAAQRAKVFLPSPSHQGPGLMRLHLEARPVVSPAALPSGDSDFRSQSFPRRGARAGANRRFSPKTE